MRLLCQAEISFPILLLFIPIGCCVQSVFLYASKIKIGNSKDEGMFKNLSVSVENKERDLIPVLSKAAYIIIH